MCIWLLYLSITKWPTQYRKQARTCFEGPRFVSPWIPKSRGSTEQVRAPVPIHHSSPIKAKRHDSFLLVEKDVQESAYMSEWRPARRVEAPTCGIGLTADSSQLVVRALREAPSRKRSGLTGAVREPPLRKRARLWPPATPAPDSGGGWSSYSNFALDKEENREDQEARRDGSGSVCCSGALGAPESIESKAGGHRPPLQKPRPTSWVKRGFRSMSAPRTGAPIKIHSTIVSPNGAVHPSPGQRPGNQRAVTTSSPERAH